MSKDSLNTHPISDNETPLLRENKDILKEYDKKPQHEDLLKKDNKLPQREDILEAAYLCSWAFDFYKSKKINSEYVYGKWKMCSSREINDILGNNFKLEVKSTGFQSLLFRNEDKGNTYFAYCTVGTDSRSIGDIFSDVIQSLAGLSPQHTRSVQNAKILNNFAKEQKAILWFIGHSLGGGLASNNSIVTGRPAITFNAAGLNILRVKMSLLMNLTYMKRNDVQFNYSSRRDRINAYIFDGEMLNATMQYICQKAYGNKKIIYPLNNEKN